MGEKNRVRKQDEYKIDLLEVLKRNPGISQTKLLGECISKTKSINMGNLAFMLYIKAIRDEAKKHGQKTYHYYYLNPLGVAIIEKNSGFNSEKIHINEGKILNEKKVSENIEPIPNEVIDQFIAKIRGYRRFEVFRDKEGRDHSDEFVYMLKEMKNYDPDLQRVYLTQIFETIDKLKGKHVKLYSDHSLQDLLIKLQSYLE